MILLRSRISVVVLTVPIVLLFSVSGAGAADTLRMIPTQKSLPDVQTAPTATRTMAVRQAQADVHSATPNRPALTAGGGSVHVNISGSNLNLLSSAQILLNGRPVSNVTASLGSPGATSRQLTLSAQSGARAGSYQVRLLAGSQTINLTATVLTAVVSAQTASGTMAGTTMRTVTTAPTKSLSQAPSTGRVSRSPGTMTTADSTSLKVSSMETLDKNRAVELQPSGGEVMRTPGASIRGSMMNAERGAGVADRLNQMKGTEGLRGGLAEPGSGRKGLDALGEGGDLASRLGANRMPGQSGGVGGIPAQTGGISDLLGNDSRSNPKSMPDRSSGFRAGDSRLMADGDGGDTSGDTSGDGDDKGPDTVTTTSSDTDTEDSEGNQEVSSTNTTEGDDGSSSTHTVSQITDSSGNVTQEQFAWSTDSSGNTTWEYSCTGPLCNPDPDSVECVGQSCEEFMAWLEASGFIENREPSDPRDTLVNPGPDGSGTGTAVGTRPERIDSKEVMDGKLSPYILTDESGDSGVPLPSGAGSSPINDVNIVDTLPDPDEGMTGSSNLPPIGTGPDSPAGGGGGGEPEVPRN